MTRDAKAAEKQRLAEALRANLRRRKAAQSARTERATAQTDENGTRETRAENTN